MSRVTRIPRRKPGRTTNGARLSSGASLILLLGLVFAQTGGTPPSTRASEAARDAAARSLSLTSGNHALGFLPGKVILAGLDHALTIEFVNASETNPVFESVDAQDVPRSVVYPELWPGVDVRYDSSSRGDVESSYVVKAAGHPDDIRLRYSVPVEVLSDGSLRFMFASGFLAESAPVAWQLIDARQIPIPVRFTQLSAREISFIVGAYDAAHELVIDPRYTWHTFYGSTTEEEWANDIAVDANGSVYVLATSDAAWNGPGDVAPLNPFVGTEDLTVVKLDRQGAYEWHTFYGSDLASGVWGTRLVADASGNVYISGYSDGAWDGPGPIAPLNPYSGLMDLFVLKLASSGAYQWHTFYGPSASYADAFDIALDAAGSIYVGGSTSATWDGPGPTAPLHAYAGGQDLFVLKLDVSGDYAWHTFYGSVIGNERAFALGLDPAGNIYAAGRDTATWDGPGPKPPLNAYAGGGDILILKLDHTGDYLWHTFYGSATGADRAEAITVDTLGKAYVSGYSATAGWNGPAGELPLNPYAGGWDIVVLNLDPDGSYKWHTFYGSAGFSEEGYDITRDAGGALYVASDSGGFNGPGAAPPWNAPSGKNDIAVLKLSDTGDYLSHAFFGSGENDAAFAVAVDNLGSVFLAGYTDATWDGPGSIPPLNAFAGIEDIAVVKLWDSPAGMPIPSDGTQACSLSAVGFNLLLTDLMRAWDGSFDRNSVKLKLDDIDVTAEAAVFETASVPAIRANLVYQPTDELSDGLHTASLTYPTSYGPGVVSMATASWTFTVAACPPRPQILLPVSPLPVFPYRPEIVLPIYPATELAR